MAGEIRNDWHLTVTVSHSVTLVWFVRAALGWEWSWVNLSWLMISRSFWFFYWPWFCVKNRMRWHDGTITFEASGAIDRSNRDTLGKWNKSAHFDIQIYGDTMGQVLTRGRIVGESNILQYWLLNELVGVMIKCFMYYLCRQNKIGSISVVGVGDKHFKI